MVRRVRTGWTIITAAVCLDTPTKIVLLVNLRTILSIFAHQFAIMTTPPYVTCLGHSQI